MIFRALAPRAALPAADRELPESIVDAFIGAPEAHGQSTALPSTRRPAYANRRPAADTESQGRDAQRSARAAAGDHA